MSAGDKFQAHIERGQHLFLAGRYDAAAEYYERALALVPNSARAMTELARCDWLSGRLKTGEAHARAAIAADPQYMDALNILSCLLVKRNKPKEAYEVARKLVESVPSSCVAVNTLGHAALALGLLDEAESLARSILRQDPAFFEAHSLLGFVAESRERYEEAAAHFRDALAIDPEAQPITESLARVSLNLTRYGDSVDLASNALLDDPGERSTQNLLHQAFSSVLLYGDKNHRLVCFAPVVLLTIIACIVFLKWTHPSLRLGLGQTVNQFSLGIFITIPFFLVLVGLAVKKPLFARFTESQVFIANYFFSRYIRNRAIALTVLLLVVAGLYFWLAESPSFLGALGSMFSIPAGVVWFISVTVVGSWFRHLLGDALDALQKLFARIPGWIVAVALALQLAASGAIIGSIATDNIPLSEGGLMLWLFTCVVVVIYLFLKSRLVVTAALYLISVGLVLGGEKIDDPDLSFQAVMLGGIISAMAVAITVAHLPALIRAVNRRA